MNIFTKKHIKYSSIFYKLRNKLPNSCLRSIYYAEGLFEVFRGVIIAKLLYAASAWWGFTSVNDKQRLAAFIRRKAFVLQTLLIFLIL